MPGAVFATCCTILNLDYVHSLEASLRGVSNEFTQSLFLVLGYLLQRSIFVGTCHKDPEQISSILSVELIFNIFYIYYCSRFPTCRCHGCCSLLKHILPIFEFCIRHSGEPISRRVTETSLYKINK